MGIAGSGKGTQGKLLGAILKHTVISTGELLRNHGSAEQQARMHRGEILADEEVTALLDKALSGLEKPGDTILDGYPRTLNQAGWLLSAQNQQRFKVRYVIHLKASPEAVKARLLDRARADDHNGAIESRFNDYKQATLPILEYYRGEGVPVIEVNAEQPIEDVHQELLNVDFSQRKKG